MKHRAKKTLALLLSLALALGLLLALGGSAYADGHTHEFEYTATGNTITANCVATSCDLPDHKATLTLASPTSLTYDGTAKAATVTGNIPTLATPTVVYKQNGAPATPTNAGTYTAEITLGTTRDEVTASVGFTITKADASVTKAPVAITNLTYSGSNQFIVTEGTASGGTMKYSLDGETYNVTRSSSIDSGNFTVYYKVFGDSNHNDTAAASLSASIAKANASVTTAPATATNLTYTGAVQNLVTEGTASGGTMQYSLDGTTYGTAIASATDAGDYTVSYKVVGDKNHNDTAPVSLPVTIARASLTDVSVQDVTLTYTGTAQTPALTATATSVNKQPVTFTYSKTETGTYGAIPSFTNVADGGTVYFKASAPNHADSAGSFTVTMNKAEGSISYAATSVQKAYGDAAFTNPLTHTGDGVLHFVSTNTDVATVSSAGLVTIAGPGTTTIIATATDSANYVYTVKEASYTLTVTASEMTVQASDYTGMYDGKAHSITVTVTKPTSGYTVTYRAADGSYVSTAPTLTNAGTLTVNYKVAATGYNDYNGEAKVTINKATPTVVAPKANTLTYTGSAQALVTAGACSMGTMQYAVNTSTTIPADASYNATVPTAVAPGTYYVWYRVAPNENLNNTQPAFVTVTIEKRTFAVSYDANGGTGAPAAQTKTDGESLTLSSTVPTRPTISNVYTVTLDPNGGTLTGSLNRIATQTTVYTFTGWSDGNGHSYQPGDVYTTEASVKLSAQWSADSNTQSVRLPIPTRTGYTFTGWATSKTAASGMTGSYTPTASITLYALWQVNSYSVTFDANGGTGTMAPQAFTYDEAQALTANGFTREGYTFDGWNTLSSGKGTAYADKAAVKNLIAWQGAAVTLYAQWKGDAYTITFDTDGGSTIEPMTVVCGAAITAPAAPTKAGYRFVSWSPALPATMPAENLKVRAVYEAVYGTPDFTLPAAVKTIEDYAFERAAMSIVYVPDTCTEIGANAFQNCTKLTQIRLPKDCAIDTSAFAGCRGITVFAPAGGTTEKWCADNGITFMAE